MLDFTTGFCNTYNGVPMISDSAQNK